MLWDCLCRSSRGRSTTCSPRSRRTCPGSTVTTSTTMGEHLDNLCSLHLGTLELNFLSSEDLNNLCTFVHLDRGQRLHWSLENFWILLSCWRSKHFWILLTWLMSRWFHQNTDEIQICWLTLCPTGTASPWRSSRNARSWGGTAQTTSFSWIGAVLE